MRRRMTQEAACDYLLKWLIRPVYRRGDNLYYETPMTTFRVSGSLMEYQRNATAWLAVGMWDGDFRVDELVCPTWRNLRWGGFVLQAKLYMDTDDLALHSAVLTHQSAIMSLEIAEEEHFQQVFEGMRVLAGLDSPEIYLDFLLDSLDGAALRWLETAIQHRS